MLLKKGSNGPNVGIIQNNLKLLGYYHLSIDCIFGNYTESAVKKFQSSYNLNSDGIVGDLTLSKLTDEIKSIQVALNIYGYNLTTDGIAGISTYNALLQFQQSHNLIVDGIVGPITRSNLFSSKISSQAINNDTHSKIYEVSLECVDFIANYESFYEKPYRGLDSQNETIGYGHVIISGEYFSKLTKMQAKALLTKDLNFFVNLVNPMIFGLIFSQNKFDALISFSYNCGITALNNSTLLKDIKANAPLEKIQADFMMWCKCNGKTALGLQRRRADEFDMYSKASYIRTFRNF